MPFNFGVDQSFLLSQVGKKSIAIAFDNPLECNIGQAPAPKITLPFSLTKTTNLIIEVAYQWNCNSTSRDGIYEVVMDSQVIFRHRQEPKDSSSQFGISLSDQQMPIYFPILMNDAPAGDHEVILQWYASSRNLQACIWMASLRVNERVM